MWLYMGNVVLHYKGYHCSFHVGCHNIKRYFFFNSSSPQIILDVNGIYTVFRTPFGVRSSRLAPSDRSNQVGSPPFHTRVDENRPQLPKFCEYQMYSG
jgi:hypothetical protein